MRGELVNEEELLVEWSKKVIACKDKLLNMALHLAPQVTHSNNQDDNYRLITDKVHEALEEISS